MRRQDARSAGGWRGVERRGRARVVSTGTFCWVDLVTSDAAAAKTFYGDLLGWETPAGERYAHAVFGGHDVAGVYQTDADEPYWMSYVAVDDANAIAARVVELGGSEVEPPFDVGENGRRAVLADPVGARFALWQPAAPPGAGLVNDVGCWCSNQLQAPDPSPAVAFYRDLLGWEIEPAEGDSYWAIHNAGTTTAAPWPSRIRRAGSSTSTSPTPTRRRPPPLRCGSADDDRHRPRRCGHRPAGGGLRRVRG